MAAPSLIVVPGSPKSPPKSSAPYKPGTITVERFIPPPQRRQNKEKRIKTLSIVSPITVKSVSAVTAALNLNALNKSNKCPSATIIDPGRFPSVSRSHIIFVFIKIFLLNSKLPCLFLLPPPTHPTTESPPQLVSILAAPGRNRSAQYFHASPFSSITVNHIPCCYSVW